jgi:hypothetical protein
VRVPAHARSAERIFSAHPRQESPLPQASHWPEPQPTHHHSRPWHRCNRIRSPARAQQQLKQEPMGQRTGLSDAPDRWDATRRAATQPCLPCSRPHGERGLRYVHLQPQLRGPPP